MSANAVGTLERGVRRRPHPHTVRALAEALGLSGGDRAALISAATDREPALAREGRVSSPLPPTALVGREREAPAAARMLSGTRLLTFTGPGGVGKTSLALEVAGEVEDLFPDGVHFVPLASIEDPALVLSAVAQALGLKEAGALSLGDTLSAELRGKEMLLVLDNFEHILAAAPEVAGLLAVCPELRVLVTSRAALRLRGEQQFPVPPLAVPDLTHIPAPEEVAAAASVELFLRRAREVEPAFDLTRTNAAAVAAICRRLDGLPLAIEIAAALAKLLSPREILARLDSALPLLVGGASDLPERQRTMRQTLAWSHDLLDDDERSVFRKLAVFTGGWTLGAAETVCAARDVPVLETISSLLDKSLLTKGSSRLTPVEGDAPRFGMLETIRAFGLEQLEASGEEEQVRARHARFYLGMAEEAEPHLNDPDRNVWMARLESEHDNLRTALSWSLSGADAERGLRLAGALFWFWFHRGHWTEGRRWMEDALARSIQGEVLPDHGRAKALFGAGAIACSQGDYAAAYPMLEESVALWRKLGNEPGISLVLIFFAVVLLGRGEGERATAIVEEAETFFRDAEDPFGHASAHSVLGLIALLREDYETSRYRFEESARIARKLGDDWLLLLPLRNLGVVALKQGDYARADRWFKESLIGLRRLEERWLIARSLEYLAEVSALLDDHVRSARLYGAAEALREVVRSFTEPHDRVDYERGVAAVREGLDERDFAAAWEKGRAMTPDQAIAYALDEEAVARGSRPKA